LPLQQQEEKNPLQVMHKTHRQNSNQHVLIKFASAHSFCCNHVTQFIHYRHPAAEAAAAAPGVSVGKGVNMAASAHAGKDVFATPPPKRLEGSGCFYCAASQSVNAFSTFAHQCVCWGGRARRSSWHSLILSHTLLSKDHAHNASSCRSNMCAADLNIGYCKQSGLAEATCAQLI
jgi:hypothetical protein